MEHKKRDVYPTKKKRNWLLIPVIVFLVLIVGFLLLFSYLQKYVVYEKGSLRIEVPFLAETNAQGEEVLDTYRPAVDAELVIDGYDFTGVETNAGEGVTALKALYVPYTDVNAEGLPSYVNRLEINNANALVLQVKPESGQLVYASTVDMAVSYGLSGNFDLATEVANLKTQNIYLVADLTCFIDDLLVQRNQTVALKNTDGTMYQTDAGYWVDPYNADIRQYLADLCTELRSYGFDEVLFTYAAHPDTQVLYSQAMTTTPDAVSAISSFSTYIENAVGDLVKLSLRCSTDALRNGVGANGQDMDFLFDIYDRVFCAGEVSTFDTDLELALGYMENPSKVRFVPTAYTAIGDSSWMLLTWTE